MRLIHSHDPDFDHRPLTDNEIKAAIHTAHLSMWEYAALGEFALAHTRECAVDRLLLALAKRLKPEGEA